MKRSRPPKPADWSSASKWHYTPKTRQLARSGGVRNSASFRLNASTAASPTNKPSSTKIEAWEHDRNAKHTKANWHFTTPNARIKLKHLYPSI